MVQVTLFPSGLSDLCIKTEWGIIPPFCQFGIFFVYLQAKLRTKTKCYATKRTYGARENKNITYIYR